MSETGPRCGRCDAPELARLCRACADRLGDDLRELARLWPGITQRASGWSRGGDLAAGRGTGTGDRMPAAALDAHDAVGACVATWGRLVAEEGIGGRQARDVAAEATRLAGLVRHLRAHDWAPDMADEIDDALTTLRGWCDRPDPAPAQLRALTREELAPLWLSIGLAHQAAVVVLGDRAPKEATVRAWAGQTGRPPRLTVVRDESRDLVQVAAVLELAEQRNARDLRGCA